MILPKNEDWATLWYSDEGMAFSPDFNKIGVVFALFHSYCIKPQVES